MLYSKWSSLTMFCPLATSLHMYFCSGCVYVFEIDASLSEIYITSWPCVSKSVQQYWFCIVFKWNKYLWLISCLIVWWNLIIEKNYWILITYQCRCIPLIIWEKYLLLCIQFFQLYTLNIDVKCFIFLYQF